MRSAIQNFLYANSASGSVMAHGSLLLKLDGVLAQALSDGLRGAVRVANVKSGKVTLLVENGSVAAKLRQMATRLQTVFRTAGIECSGVEVKVQPLEILFESKSSTVKPLSEVGISHLQNLSNSLPEGEPLRAALEHLVAQAARK